MSIDTTIQSFKADVIDASAQTPVLVDFWAPWCGPCKTLGPMLESLEAAYGGRFKLVKVDTEQEQQLAQHFQIRSIPTVFAFVDGQPVDQFQGAQPEAKLREFIDRLMPNPADIEMDQAAQAIEAGNHDAAAEHAKRAIALDPANDAARLLFAQLLLASGDPGAAQAQMEALSEPARTDPQVAELASRIAAAVDAARVPAPPDLLARVATDPADLAARQELAEHYVGCKEWAEAFEHLLEIVRADRTFGDDHGRRRMIEVFKLAAGQPALVSEWRRRLGATMNVA